MVDQVGTWKIKFDFLGAYYPSRKLHCWTGIVLVWSESSAFRNQSTISPSSDGQNDFVVQTELVISWPSSPLPTDYWTRPVSPENREWWPILGNYPATGIVEEVLTASRHEHVHEQLWLHSIRASAKHCAHSMETTGRHSRPHRRNWDQYPSSLASGGGNPSIIYAGRCYQTLTKIRMNGVSTTVWECYDLRTGQVYWEHTRVLPSTHKHYYTERTVQSYQARKPARQAIRVNLVAISGGRLIKYNPYTGAATLNISFATIDVRHLLQ